MRERNVHLQMWLSKGEKELIDKTLKEFSNTKADALLRLIEEFKQLKGVK